MRPNFTACGADFLNFSQHNTTYNYNGTVHGIFSTSVRPSLITFEGCQDLCGTGTQYYAWKDASYTITTWVFPVIGILLQAPYESNKNWSTALALARWIGNPIAGMSYTFWNIKVIGKCANLVDMASSYDEVPGADSQFAQIRDSLYILSVMNQYTIKPYMPMDPAEKLLRVALFSDSLQLTAAEDRTNSLVKMRKDLAKFVRTGRKKGVIEVFVSIGLFVVALGISIQAAFTELGSAQQAHDLALGLLLNWVPVLVLSSVTDRNPVATDEIRLQLNDLLDLVRAALLNRGRRESYISAIGGIEDDFKWTKALEDEDYFHKGFFTEFAGQGRVRWHNGCAHSILSSMEDAWIADHGRDWLHDADRARTRMISDVEPNHHQLVWFDPQMFWQISGSIMIFYCTIGGAFILSYFTPTFGLGCRSGGYMIYVIIASTTFIAEIFLWLVRATSRRTPKWIPQWMRRDPLEEPISWIFGHVQRNLERQNSDHWVATAREGLRILRRKWTSLGSTDKLGLFLRVLEILNSAWLAYIVCAQTFGSYRNCKCQCSTWSSLGGYMDFEAYQFYRANGIKYYWGCGTALSCVFLAAGLMYIVVEYYTQSHLNTEDYESAAQGLRKVRRFKKRTVWFRHLAKFLLKSMHVMTWGTLKSDSKTLSWDWRTKEDQEQIANLVPRNPPGQGRRPSSNVSNPSDSGDEGHSPSASLSDRDTSSEMHTLTSLVQAQIEPHSQL